MGAVVRIEQYQQKNEIEKWRQAGYAAVDEMVKKLSKDIEGEDFQELSEKLRQDGQSITGAILEEVIKSRGAKQRAAEMHVCGECGRTLKREKKLHERTIESLNGEIKIERPYFYCKYCAKGYYPFDEELGIAEKKKQYDLQKAAAELFTEVPYKRASQIFERLTGIRMSDHTMHEIAKEMGEAADAVHVLPSRQMVERTIEEAGNGRVWRPVLVVAADGAHMPTRPQAKSRKEKRGAGEWREAKGFRIYLVGQERINQIMSWHQIGTEEEFGEALKYAATLIPVERVRVALLGDGAKWIWKHLKEAFPSGKEILDYYHCSESVHEVGKVQFSDDEYRQALWIESVMARLNYGDVESVIWGLQRMKPTSTEASDKINELIGYLRNNAHRIDYESFKRGQYPRGSGGIESANKFICHVRMKRSGAWWYVINGNEMLRLRCAFYNETFDQVFARYKRLK